MDEKLRESSLTINIEESILSDVLNRVKNSRLINDFGNLETLLDNTDKIKQEKRRIH